MHRDDIQRYLREVGRKLSDRGLTGEILLLGGAYMTLVLRERETTKDVDAYFAGESAAIREAAVEVAEEQGLPPDWLNDAAKGFLYTQPESDRWLDTPGLRVHAPRPDFVFALKAFAGRPEDLRDLTALRETLSLQSVAEALAIVQRYIPERLLTPRVQYLLEDLFDSDA